MVLKASFKKPRIVINNTYCALQHWTEGGLEKSDVVKQLYLEVCSSKQKFLATLKCKDKAKNDPATLRHIETEMLRKALAELKKVSAAVAVLNVGTTTDPLRNKTLIDMQLINISPFY